MRSAPSHDRGHRSGRRLNAIAIVPSPRTSNATKNCFPILQSTLEEGSPQRTARGVRTAHPVDAAAGRGRGAAEVDVARARAVRIDRPGRAHEELRDGMRPTWSIDPYQIGRAHV